MPYELFAGPDGLRRIIPLWTDLECRVPVHPYQSATFARLWHEHVGTRIGAKPLVVAYTDSDGVRGVFPACVVPYGPVRLLTWLGGPLLQDCGDVLWDSSADISAEQFVTEALSLLRRKAPAALLYMCNVRHDAVCYNPLSRLLTEFKSSAAPYVQVPKDRSRLLSLQTERPGFGSIMRKVRRFERLSHVGFEVMSPHHPEADATMTWLFERKKERFGNGRGRSDLYRPGHEEFRRAQARELAGMRISRLSVDGNTVAAELSCLRNDRLYGMLTAFDPAAAKYSPGVVLTFRVLEHCVGANISVFDLGWGQQPDKYHWTDVDVRMTTFVSAGLQGSVLVGAARVRRALAG